MTSFFFVRNQNVSVVDTFYRTINYWTGNRKRIEVSAKGPPFIHSIFNVRYKTRRYYRVPPLFFSALCDFFSNFLSPKGPLSSFLRFCSRVPPFTILKTWRFLSFRYSADFIRSLLVSRNTNEIRP